MAREDVLELLRVPDWRLALSVELEDPFWRKLEVREEENPMSHVTSWERWGMERGRQEVILDNRSSLHGAIPPPLATRIRQITDPERLRLLQRALIGAESLDAFAMQIEG